MIDIANMERGKGLDEHNKDTRRIWGAPFVSDVRSYYILEMGFPTA